VDRRIDDGVAVGDRLGGHVDVDLGVRVGLDEVLQRLDVLLVCRDRRNTEREAVTREDLRERLADDRVDPQRISACGRAHATSHSRSWR